MHVCIYKQIDLFSKRITISSIEEDADSENQLNKFRLKPISLARHPRLIGKTIRESGLTTERAKAIVVGLERGTDRLLNPELDLTLEAEDTLYIVTERKTKPALI